MTKRIDFYILEKPNYQACIPFTCQLLAKAYAQNCNITVQSETKIQLQELDRQLWSYQADSFIPHIVQDGDNPSVLVQKLLAKVADVLLLLRIDATPYIMDDLQRLLQVVPSDEAQRQLAREHYRHYQQQGYEVKVHKC